MIASLKRAVKRIMGRPPAPNPPVPVIPTSSTPFSRVDISWRYLKGSGIEIGALHFPLPVSPEARVKYVDRMSVKDLREQYPELSDQNLVEVDIIADGERLETVADGSQDFVIANHFLEHCQNPLAALKNSLRVLKSGGVMFLAIPDKRNTFDVDRPTTSLEHLFRDYEEGPEGSRQAHYEEYSRLVDKVEGEEALRQAVKFNMDRDYSIHFHVWTSRDMIDMIQRFQAKVFSGFDVDLMTCDHLEGIFILRKT